MFLVNSRFPLFCATSSCSCREGIHSIEVILFPKLRMQFAEFLNRSSPKRLGILYLPTCVGFGYGHRVNSLEAFLGSMGSVTSAITARYHVSGFVGTGFAWAPPYTLTPGQPAPGITYPPASPHCLPPRSGSVRSSPEGLDIPLATTLRHGRAHGGTGISTSCASTTPLGLALAPDSPWED